MFLSLDPLAIICMLFQAMAPTLAVWPQQVWMMVCLTQSQSCTQPEWVPTARVLPVGLKLVLVIMSSLPTSTNLATLELPAFHKYTELLNPTASKFVIDQSIKLRQQSSYNPGASSTFAGTLLMRRYFFAFLILTYQGIWMRELVKSLFSYFQEAFQSLQVYLRMLELEKEVMLSVEYQARMMGPQPNTYILQMSVTVRPRFSLLRSGLVHSSYSSIQSICSLQRSLADMGIFRMGKNLSAQPLSFKFYFLGAIKIYLFENLTVLRWALSYLSMLQFDRGREFCRYRLLRERDLWSVIRMLQKNFLCFFERFQYILQFSSFSTLINNLNTFLFLLKGLLSPLRLLQR